MDTIPGIVAALGLAVIMFGFIIVKLTKDIETLELNQRSYLAAIKQIYIDINDIESDIRAELNDLR